MRFRTNKGSYGLLRRLHGRFKEIGRTAILGMGAAPGITNLLVRYGADRLDTVSEIHARVASRDRTRYAYKPALPLAYSLKTILEEFSMPPAVFSRGRLGFVEPMSGGSPHRFPPPIGWAKPMFTLHSEVATLPAVAAQMLAAGKITVRGALPPELAVPVECFFNRLKERKMTMKAAKIPGWGLAA